MSAKIIVPVCWTGDENDEYDIEMMIDDFTEKLEELTGTKLRTWTLFQTLQVDRKETG